MLESMKHLRLQACRPRVSFELIFRKSSVQPRFSTCKAASQCQLCYCLLTCNDESWCSSHEFVAEVDKQQML